MFVTTPTIKILYLIIFFGFWSSIFVRILCFVYFSSTELVDFARKSVKNVRKSRQPGPRAIIIPDVATTLRLGDIGGYLGRCSTIGWSAPKELLQGAYCPSHQPHRPSPALRRATGITSCAPYQRCCLARPWEWSRACAEPIWLFHVASINWGSCL